MNINPCTVVMSHVVLSAAWPLHKYGVSSGRILDFPWLVFRLLGHACF